MLHIGRRLGWVCAVSLSAPYPPALSATDSQYLGSLTQTLATTGQAHGQRLQQPFKVTPGNLRGGRTRDPGKGGKATRVNQE